MRGGEAALARVLSAYAACNKDVGYCQSMNFITGMLLLHLNEAEAFAMLDTIVSRILPRDYFSPGMIGSKVDIERVFTALIAKKLPVISRHLDAIDFTEHLSLLVRQWFLCLFVLTMPAPFTLRIWDSLFYEGSKVLMRVGEFSFSFSL
jgi:hypothetical protein